MLVTISARIGVASVPARLELMLADRTSGHARFGGACRALWHHGRPMSAPRRASRRRVRLRRRRPDRPARAARLAADRGLPRTSATRRASRTASARQDELQEFAIEIADHLLAVRRQAARGGLQRGQRGGARTRSSAIWHAGGRRRRDRRASRRPRSSPWPGSRSGRIGLLATPATVASGAYERAVRGRRSARPPRERRLPGPGADHPGGLSRSTRQVVRDRPRLLRAAARGRGRHGDPRLHALPAGRADAPADAGPRA